MVQLAATKRTTLYRMLEGGTLETALTESRRESDDDFTVTDLVIEKRPARLVAGSITTRAKWATDLKLLTGQSVSLSNSSPGAALLIQDAGEVVWAVTWGTGFHFLDSEQIDFGFGAGIVARSALPAEVKSLTKTILDHRARVDRSSMPNGSTIRDLGVDGYGEVVTRIEAKAVIADLTVGDKVIQLRAADSLNVPLAKSPERLMADLEVLHELSLRQILPGLESLEQLIALKPKDSRVPALDQKLVEALKVNGSHRLGIAWPHERLDVYGPVMSVKVTGFGDRERRVSEQAPEISDVLAWFAEIPAEEVLDRLKAVRVELHSEADPQGHTLAATPVPLRRWLAFEVEDGNQRFCLHDGSWYRMDDQYLARIDARVNEILAEPASLQLPPWGSEYEDKYNQKTAKALAGYCLDRKLITTPLHSRGGIEPCDVFVPPGILIHVKRGRSSADLSHLLAQGLVSTDALARDENARAAWRARIEEESGGTVKNAELKEVVLAIGSEHPVTVDTLFTFTKVNLVKQFDALRYLGVQVHVTTVSPPTAHP
ncbi:MULTISPECIES: DUF6119 family protein [Microbacterium]|uniref:DUF6119 family protein n=1 Tax=Microbacterium TaxID=33882 RepID=UPI00278B291C|nr:MULTISPECIES: DUF6119 family protein [Microbacterium]MDQ1077274.1 uncharacterized protein (TIGR04141 family) [Microbacterium sp. SORGH_AS_0969]MDQ1117518.1 uncharacterized protein (TIGR04141 family) [Microbacterium testaceum]